MTQSDLIGPVPLMFFYTIPHALEFEFGWPYANIANQPLSRALEIRQLNDIDCADSTFVSMTQRVHTFTISTK